MNAQELHNTERTEAKVASENGEETVEEDLRPPDFGHKNHNDLKDDKEAVRDAERGAGRLIRDGAVGDVLVRRGGVDRAVRESGVRGAAGLVQVDEGVDGLDVVHEGVDGAGEDEDAADTAEDAHGVQAEEHIWIQNASAEARKSSRVHIQERKNMMARVVCSSR